MSDKGGNEERREVIGWLLIGVFIILLTTDGCGMILRGYDGPEEPQLWDGARGKK